MTSLRLLSATPAGTAEFELLADAPYGNLNGVVHGGAVALIFDMCTTSALGPLARPKYWECVFVLSSFPSPSQSTPLPTHLPPSPPHECLSFFRN